MKRWLKDPLALFLALGVLIFLAADLLPGDDADDYLIEITDRETGRLSDQWQAQMGRPPTEDELAGLVDQFVREEVYYREAMRMSLDQNDVIVRRRMVQKLTFLTEDVATTRPPSEAELRAHYEENQDDYRLPVRYSFRHRYFSVDRREDAEADAVAALGDATVAGDPFMLQRAFAERSVREIAALFGESFSQDLAELDAGEDWQGPLRSAYGWHLVQIEHRLPEELPGFEQLKDKVTVDLQAQRRELANQTYLDGLMERYEVRKP